MHSTNAKCTLAEAPELRLTQLICCSIAMFYFHKQNNIMHQQKVEGDLGRHVSNINELNKLELLKKLKPIKLKLELITPTSIWEMLKFQLVYWPLGCAHISLLETERKNSNYKVGVSLNEPHMKSLGITCVRWQRLCGAARAPGRRVR